MATSGEAVAQLNAYLAIHCGVAPTTYATEYVQLHTGTPGAAGTANVSAMSTRNPLTFNTPSNATMTKATLGTFTMTATETITHATRWSAASGGTFLGSHDLTTPVPVIAGSIVSFTTFTMSCGPAAS